MSIFSNNSVRRILFGGPAPDLGNPLVRERRRRSFAAGQRFAVQTGLDRLGARFLLFADRHRVLYVCTLLAFVFFVALLGIIRLIIL